MNQRGSIFIFALWILAILAFLSVSLAGRIQQKMHVFSQLEERDKARWVADSALFQVVHELQKRSPEGPFTLRDCEMVGTLDLGALSVGEGTASIGDVPRPNADTSGTYLQGEVRPQGLGFDATNLNQNYVQVDINQQNQLFYGIIDENRKVNINHADRLILIAFFRLVAEVKDEDAVHLAHALIDYRDADDYVRDQGEVGGTEAGIYRSLDFDYLPKNQDFDAESEMLRVPGMSLEIYSRIKKYVTVYGDGRVNIHTASPVVLEALGLSPDLIHKILVYRSGEDGIEGTEDDQQFDQLNTVEATLDGKYRLTEREKVSLRHVVARRQLSISSDVFRITSRAVVNKVHTRSQCVFDLRGGIQSWIEL